MAYNMADRAKEWTTYAGIAVSIVAVVVPELIPTKEWVQIWGAAQLLLGAAMIFVPQSAGTTAVENEALALLQALSAKIPPQYAASMQPFLAILAKAAMQPALPAPAPAPTVTDQSVPGVLIPQPKPAPAPAEPVTVTASPDPANAAPPAA